MKTIKALPATMSCGLLMIISLAGWTEAQASIPDASGVFTACYDKHDGEVRVIDTAKITKCKSGEIRFTWSSGGGTGGTQGSIGPQGPAGPAGAIGPKGVPGPVGPVGAMGSAGAAGAIGPKGDTGAVGAAGPAGLQGLKGDPGVAGPAGATGATGPAGPQGPAGTGTASSLQNEITVSASGGDFTSPVDAVNSILDASATNPYVVRIGPGVYDLGSNRLVMKPFVSVMGAGQAFTIITGIGSSSDGLGLVQGASDTTLRDLSVQVIGSATANNARAITNSNASPRIERVTASASGGTNSNIGVLNAGPPTFSPTMIQVIATAVGPAGVSLNFGVSNSGTSTTMIQVTASASGGFRNTGVANSAGASPTMSQVTASASGGSDSNIGVSSDNTTSPIMTQVTGSGSGAGISSGLFLMSGGTSAAQISNSSFKGTPGIFAFGGFNNATRISNTRAEGGVGDANPGTQCRDVFDANLVEIVC